MVTDTSEKIISYIGKEKQVMPNELVGYLGISRQAVFKQLKKLIQDERIDKKGNAPKTVYVVRHQKTLQEIRKELIPLLQQYDIDFAGIFGSYARGEATKKSDVDILVNFSKQKSLLEIVGIEQHISEALHMKVDMVLEKSLNKHIKPYVMQDLKIIYEKR